jgi:hypothetical protein
MIEVRKVLNQNVRAYHGENFELRDRLLDLSSSYQIMVYPKYMMVNKTSMVLVSEK